jgi:hypothetical protein
MKRTFKVFEPKEIMYSSPGNHYTQVVMVRPYKLTKDQEQRAWAAAARRVRQDLSDRKYCLEHPDEFEYLPGDQYSDGIFILK